MDTDGAEIAPYSVKVGSYFRYTGIPHEWICRNAETQADCSGVRVRRMKHFFEVPRSADPEAALRGGRYLPDQAAPGLVVRFAA